MERFLDQTDFPCLIVTAQVLQVVVAIDVYQVKFAVTRAVGLLFEPIVQGCAVGFVYVAPENQHAFTTLRVACHFDYVLQLAGGLYS